MKSLVIRAGCGLLLLLGLGACQRVETDFDPNTDFTAYRTFAWEPRQQAMETEVQRDYPHLMDDIRAAIATGMVVRGMVHVEPNQADLRLNVYLELAPYTTDASADGSKSGTDMPSRELGPLVIAPYSVTQVEDVNLNRQLQEGTLMLNITDGATSNLVWQGWLHKVIDMDNLRDVEWGKSPDAGDVRYRRRMVARAVERLLAPFPTTAGKSAQADKPVVGRRTAMNEESDARRYLYLVRHAKAVNADGLPDFDRPLHKRGAKDVPRIANRLASRGVKPDRMISSDACRALATARLFAEALRYPADQIVEDHGIYKADAGDLLQIVHGFDPAWRQVVLFGHNPTITDLANALTDAMVNDIPTCGVMEVAFDGDWAALSASDGEALFFDYPQHGD